MTEAQAVAKALHALEKLSEEQDDRDALKQRAAETAADASVVLEVYVGVLAAVREAAGVESVACASASVAAASKCVTLAERIADTLATGSPSAVLTGAATHRQELFVLVVSNLARVEGAAAGPLAEFLLQAVYI